MKLSVNKIGIFILCCFVSCVCGAADEPVPGANMNSDTPPLPKEYTDSLVGMPAPIVDCVVTNRLAQDGTAAYTQNRFEVKTPAIYFVCTSTNAKRWQKLVGIWFAVNTNGMIPNNDVLSKIEMTAESDASNSKPWIATFAISMPPKGWPVGEYRIDLYYKKSLITSQNVTVTFNTNAW